MHPASQPLLLLNVAVTFLYWPICLVLMVRRMQRQAVFYHSRSAALALGHLQTCMRKKCVYTCRAQKLQHAEYADEHTISQVHASKLDERTLTN